MPQPKYPRGSEWRRWDLHIHTPFSALNNGFGSDFDAYARAVLTKAVQSEIAAIGITDYFSIEGYRRFRSLMSDESGLEQLLGEEIASKANKILVLPNIEFRTPVVITRRGKPDARVNLHVLFSDELLPSQLEENFLRELRFTAQSEPGSTDDSWSLSQANLEALGRRLKSEHTEFEKHSDLFVGMMNAVINHEEITQVLTRQRSRFSNRYLIVVPIDEDLSNCSWNGQAHLTRKLFIQKSDMFFSGNPGTRDFGLGKKHPTIGDYIREFKSVKPCIHGSDAHSFDRLFEPDEGRFLWIKADPTFDGLRQLLNEADDRVFIGTLPASVQRVKANRTKVLKSIAIKKADDSKLNEAWFDCNIPLNPEMVAIIGNKGSGKSALSDALGLAGGTRHHGSFSFLTEDRFRDKRKNKAKHFHTTVTWLDDTTDGPVSLNEDPDEESIEKIHYLPQSYLEEICNEIGLGSNSRFYGELQKAIFSHVPRSERLGFDTLGALLQHRGKEVNEAIDLLARTLSEINGRIAAIEERLLPANRGRLEAQLGEKQRELDAHERTKPEKPDSAEEDPTLHEASREAQSALDTANELLRNLESTIAATRAEDAQLALKRSAAEKLLTRFDNLQKLVTASLDEAAMQFDAVGLQPEDVVKLTVNRTPITKLIEDADHRRREIDSSLNAAVEGSLEAKKQHEQERIQALTETLDAPQRAHQAYLERLAEWESARSTIVGAPDQPGTLTEVSGAIDELDRLPDELHVLDHRRRRLALEILREKKRLHSYYASYYGAAQSHLNQHPVASAHFAVTFDVAIAESGFVDEFMRRIHQGKAGSFTGSDHGKSEIKGMIDQVNWESARDAVRFAESVVRKLKSSGGQDRNVADQLKVGTPKALYDFIFSFEYLAPIYRLTWKGKGLERLSPGERGNLLLIFYLLVDRGETPLLIDQPEENLDNQSIVETLVPCIRDAKRRRQVIMVTHNPNLAVVCDADQIVHAAIEKDGNFQVCYTSGSIEDPTINRMIVDVLEGTRPAFDKRDSKYLTANA